MSKPQAQSAFCLCREAQSLTDPYRLQHITEPGVQVTPSPPPTPHPAYHVETLPRSLYALFTFSHPLDWERENSTFLGPHYPSDPTATV